MYMKCIYCMSVLGELHTRMQIKWFVEIIRYWTLLQSTLGDLVYTSRWETFHCLRMRLQIPLQKRLQNAVLYNQRTSIRLTDFAVHSCFLCTYMFDCKFGAIFPLATRPRAAVLSCFISTLKTPTAMFFGLPPGLPPADLTLYYNRWQWLGLCLQHFSNLDPAQQGRQSAESSITVETQGHTKSWIGVGEGYGFLSLRGFVWIGRFHCGMIFTVAIVLNSGKCWRVGMSCQVHRYSLHLVCRRWLNTDDSAVPVSMWKILLLMETWRGSRVQKVLQRCFMCLFWRCLCSWPGGQQSVCVRARDGAQPSAPSFFKFLASVSE